MKILQGLWANWWRVGWRGTLGVALASVALLVPRPAAAQFCSNCIYNQSALQTGAQYHVQTGAVDGTLTVGTLSASALNIGALTATTLTGDGSHLTVLNASALSSGTVPSGLVTGPYTGITAVGTITAGVWNGSAIPASRGGLGDNFSTVNPGSVLYASGVGRFSALPSPSFLGVLESTGTNGIPVWVSSPALQGYNFTNVPLSALLPGTLSTSIGVADGSLTTVSAAKVVGNISGGASFLTALLPVNGIAAGTWPTSNPASSVTATGTPSGTFGGPTTLAQIRVGGDGRVYDVKQFNLVVPPPVISTGALPAGVTLGAPAITSGTLAANVIASSVAASGAPVGTFGGAAQTLTVTDLVDGRIAGISAQNIALPLAQLNSGSLPGGITMSAAQLTPGTWPSNIPVSSVAASGVTAGTCGGPGVSCAPVFGADGRATSYTQYTIPGVSTTSVLNNIDNAWAHSQTSLMGSSWTINGILYANQVISANFNGIGTNLSGLNPANLNPGVLPANVAASSVSIPWLVVPGSITAGASFYGDGSHMTGISTAAFSGGTVSGQTTFLSSVTINNGLYVRGPGMSGPNPTPMGTPPAIFSFGPFAVVDNNPLDNFITVLGTAANTPMFSVSTGGVVNVASTLAIGTSPATSDSVSQAFLNGSGNTGFPLIHRWRADAGNAIGDVNYITNFDTHTTNYTNAAAWGWSSCDPAINPDCADIAQGFIHTPTNGDVGAEVVGVYDPQYGQITGLHNNVTGSDADPGQIDGQICGQSPGSCFQPYLFSANKVAFQNQSSPADTAAGNYSAMHLQANNTAVQTQHFVVAASTPTQNADLQLINGDFSNLFSIGVSPGVAYGSTGQFAILDDFDNYPVLTANPNGDMGLQNNTVVIGLSGNVVTPGHVAAGSAVVSDGSRLFASDYYSDFDSSETVSIVQAGGSAENDIYVESGNGSGSISMKTYHAENGAPSIVQRASRGTSSSPLAIQSGDTLGFLQWGGYNGTDSRGSAQQVAQASENWSGSAMGTSLIWQTTKNGALPPSGRRTVMTLGNDGSLSVPLSSVTASAFFGDGSHLTGVLPSADIPNTVFSSFTVTGAGGLNVTYGVVAATATLGGGSLAAGDALTVNSSATVAGILHAGYSTSATNSCGLATSCSVSCAAGLYRIGAPVCGTGVGVGVGGETVTATSGTCTSLSATTVTIELDCARIQ